MEWKDASTLSPAQYARLSGLSLGYVYGRLWSGRLAGAQKVDGQWRIPVAALESLKKSTEPVSVRNLYEEASRMVDAMTAHSKATGRPRSRIGADRTEITARLGPDFRVTRDGSGELLIEPATSTEPRLDNLRALQQIGKETK